MRAFSILQKWSKVARMTPDDHLTVKMVITEPSKKNKTLFKLHKIHYFWRLRAKNEFDGNDASFFIYRKRQKIGEIGGNGKKYDISVHKSRV